MKQTTHTVRIAPELVAQALKEWPTARTLSITSELPDDAEVVQVAEVLGAHPEAPGVLVVSFHSPSAPEGEDVREVTPLVHQADRLTFGALLIAEERQRQIDHEGYDAPHDDEHDDGELLEAARCYLAPWPDSEPGDPPEEWPWRVHHWNPGPDRKRDLVKAGALIAAELDRLHRAEQEPA
jgi:hypothetical protein